MNRLLTGDRHIDVLAVLVVLHVLALIGLRLVVITGAVGGDFHPRAVRHIELTNERRLKIGKIKADQITATKAEIVVTPCHNCVDQLTQINHTYKLGITIKTVAELVADALVIEN